MSADVLTRIWSRLAPRRRAATPADGAEPAGASASHHPARHGDELQELAETFRVTVARLSALVRELEEAHQQALRIEQERKLFYRDVLRAVTVGKFELVDPDQIPVPGELAAEVEVADGAGYAAARSAIRSACRAAGMPEERECDLLLAAGEAITNAMKHAGSGWCCVYRSPDLVALRVADRGGGIRSTDLPAAILTSGFSTQVSLGMGYTMMLKLCDRVWLSTGAEGTVIQLEKRVRGAEGDGG